MTRWLAIANGVPEGAPSAPIANKVSLVSFVTGGHGEKSLADGGDATPFIDPHPMDERVAIMMAGGMPEDWAAGFAALCPDTPPSGLSKGDWLRRLDGALSFADVHGASLGGLGWPFEALFGVGKDWVRLDQRGNGWFIAEALSGGGRVLEADASKIRFAKANSARFTVWR